MGPNRAGATAKMASELTKAWVIAAIGERAPVRMWREHVPDAQGHELRVRIVRGAGHPVGDERAFEGQGRRGKGRRMPVISTPAVPAETSAMAMSGAGRAGTGANQSRAGEKCAKVVGSPSRRHGRAARRIA